jgi:23S rRNA (guanine745-N1)-methyltransferase
MKMTDNQSLVCSVNHSFDMSRDGYFHLLPNAKPTKYNKELFEARKLINASGYFERLLQTLASGISRSMPWRANAFPLSILDAGCGEGSHLAYLQDTLQGLSDQDILAVGADLSKPGIITAAKGSSRVIWCVADLARSPFQDQTFDIIVNILSPSNYGEFQRLLAANGMLVKVIPGPEYLKEFKQLLYGRSTPGQQDTLEETAVLFAKHFPETEQQHVRYEIELPPEHIKGMLKMTPLSWHAPKENIQKLLLSRPSLKLTFDFYILWSKPFSR